MSSSQYIFRRATADDVPQLVQMWKAAQLPAEQLEKRFTEFQVVVNEIGELVGAVGLQTLDKQGWLHSETIPDFALVDKLRPLLWERILNVAQNYGLVRFWTIESAPFWRQQDFVPPDGEAGAKLPRVFGDPGAPWLTLKLKEEVETVLNLDKEFQLFQESELEKRERMVEQARFLHGLAILIAIAMFIFVIIGSIYLLKNRHFLQK